MGTVLQSNASLSVGEVAWRSGVSVSAIHFYERKGLIEGWRSGGNQRRYARSVLRRIAIIRIGQQAGIGLAVIGQFFDRMPSDQPLSREDWQILTTAWRSMLDERIRRLVQLRDYFDRCIGCGCLSLTDCPLRNKDDHLGSKGAGARVFEDDLSFEQSPSGDTRMSG